YIKNFAKRALPLTNLLRKDIPFEWTSETQAAFEDIKEAILNPPVLALPNPAADLQITTDASSYGIGAVLEQKPFLFEKSTKSYRQTSSHFFQTKTSSKIFGVVLQINFFGKVFLLFGRFVYGLNLGVLEQKRKTSHLKLVAVHIIRAHSDSEHFRMPPPTVATCDKRNSSCWFLQAPSQQTSPSLPLEYFAYPHGCHNPEENFGCWFYSAH
ncbi:retrovirus-related Pol polyprotein from transposon 17.6, partial [Trichonephila inaurata madagascariensis]